MGQVGGVRESTWGQLISKVTEAVLGPSLQVCFFIFYCSIFKAHQKAPVSMGFVLGCQARSKGTDAKT